MAPQQTLPATTSVSNSVLAIIATFASGLDVLKKLHHRRRRKRTHGKRKPDELKLLDEDEQRLSRSLTRGPEDVAREYQKSVYVAGEQYAIGDALAQNGLAAILLRVNTGLVGIIAAFLDERPPHTNTTTTPHTQADYRALTLLADRAREDTCLTLRHLLSRMRHAAPAIEAPQAGEECKPHRRKDRRPTLARITVANSSKPSQIALVRAGEKSGGEAGRDRKPTKAKKQASAGSGSNVSKPPPTPTPATKPTTQPPKPPQPLRAPQASTPTLLPPPLSTPPPQYQQAASPLAPSHPMPPMPPMPTAPRRPTRQSTAAYSTATASTKLGEIPLHRWPEVWDAGEAERRNAEEARGWGGGGGGVGGGVGGIDGGEGGRRRGWRGLFGRGRRGL